MASIEFMTGNTHFLWFVTIVTIQIHATEITDWVMGVEFILRFVLVLSIFQIHWSASLTFYCHSWCLLNNNSIMPLDQRQENRNIPNSTEHFNISLRNQKKNIWGYYRTVGSRLKKNGNSTQESLKIQTISWSPQFSVSDAPAKMHHLCNVQRVSPVSTMNITRVPVSQ